MRYLIDTHVLIWYLNADKSLPDKYVAFMHDQKNELCISIASIWELTIKMSSGKLELYKSIQEVEEYLISMDYNVIAVSFAHLKTLFDLPKHHGDPFDRLIISQAITENLTILSADRQFKDYPVNVIWSTAKL